MTVNGNRAAERVIDGVIPAGSIDRSNESNADLWLKIVPIITANQILNSVKAIPPFPQRAGIWAAQLPDSQR